MPSFWENSGLSSPPSPEDRDAFLAWIASYRQAFLQACPLDRSTTFYIDQDAAGDSTGGAGDGSEGNPWLVSTWDDCRTLIAANLADDTRFRLRRGRFYVGAGGLTINNDSVTIDAWGSGHRPIIARATLVPSGQSLWVNGGGQRWRYIAGFTTATLRIARTDWRREWEGWTRASSVSAVQSDTSSARLWVPDGGNVWVNDRIERYGQTQTETINPNDLDWLLYEQNSDHGIDIRGSGCRIDNIDVEGFGLNPDNVDQAYGIRVANTDHAPALTTNSSVLYGGVHVVGSNHGFGLPGSPIGGAAMWENIRFGWSFAELSGPTATYLNSFAKGGLFEVYCRNCWAVAGVVQDVIRGVAGDSGTAFNSHTADGAPQGVYVLENSGVRAVADSLPSAVFNASNMPRPDDENERIGFALSPENRGLIDTANEPRYTADGMHFLTLNASDQMPLTAADASTVLDAVKADPDFVAVFATTPDNKIATNASGEVVASNMRGTDGANTVAPPSAGSVASQVKTELFDTDSQLHKIAVDNLGNIAVNTQQLVGAFIGGLGQNPVGDYDVDWRDPDWTGSPESVLGRIGPFVDTLHAKLPTGDRNMAGAGTTATNLDQVSGGGGGATTIPFLSRRIGPDHTIKLTSRSTKELADRHGIVLTPGQRNAHMIKFAGQLADGDIPDELQQPTSRDESIVTITEWGIDSDGNLRFRPFASAQAAPGSVTHIDFDFGPEAEDSIPFALRVDVVALETG